MLVRSLGHRGLALGTASAALLNAGVLLWLLRGRLGGLEGRRLVNAVLKISSASGAMALTAYHAERILHVPFGGGGILAQGIRVFGAIGIALAVLALSAHLLRVEEFDRLRRRALGS